MDFKKAFSEYLYKIENKKKQVSYNYSIAIDRLSKHFSDQKKERFDFYEDLSIDTFEAILKLYNRGGQFEMEGDYGNGTNRAAINALGRFKNFLLENDIADLITNEITDYESDKLVEEDEGLIPQVSNLFSYEKDLKRIVIEQVEVLFPGYEIFEGIENGVEYLIKSKRIDILLSNKNKDFLIVELKAGKAKFEVFGQISMYIGLLQEKFPNNKIDGCIIANEIDKSLEYAVKTNIQVKLKTYSMQLSLQDY